MLLALEGFEKATVWTQAVAKLVDCNLLLHRRHIDELSVWHGTELDLRARLEDDRQRLGDDFDLLAFLAKEARPPAWKPVQYNDDYYVRHITGRVSNGRTIEFLSQLGRRPERPGQRL